jgi:hypothetical protein
MFQLKTKKMMIQKQPSQTHYQKSTKVCHFIFSSAYKFAVIKGSITLLAFQKRANEVLSKENFTRLVQVAALDPSQLPRDLYISVHNLLYPLTDQ